MSGKPEIAVVVLSMGAPPFLAGAVRSVLDQGIAAEIVVVNSAGGDAAGLLRRHGMDVPVIECQERLYVGGARNLGIAATTAPYVAFLADDCLAAPGWIANRLRLHRAGCKAVASAVLHDKPRSRVAWAHHFLLFARRLPDLPPDKTVRFGVSFAREVLETYGPYDAGLPVGEDTDFNSRLPEELRPVWAPRVVTLHRNCDRIVPMLLDMIRRGHRYALARRRERGHSIATTMVEIARNRKKIRRLAELGVPGRARMIERTRLLVALGTLCKFLGAGSALLRSGSLPMPQPAPAGRRVITEA